jgi:hypothetical protein
VIRLVKLGEYRKVMEGLFNMIKVLVYSTFYPTPNHILPSISSRNDRRDRRDSGTTKEIALSMNICNEMSRRN